MNKFKKFIRSGITQSMLPYTRTMETLRPGMRILMYHRVCKNDKYDQLTVDPDKFSEQIRYLSEHYRIISLDNVIAELESGSIKKNTVAVTFDDGYLDNLVYAIPILEKYKVPATIFITSQFCDQVKRHPRYNNEKQRLHLDWDEVKELHVMPGITIGSHTLSHPYLSSLDAVESKNEIIESKKIIEEKIGSPVNYFCYPSGDFGVREMNFVKEAGYLAAVTVAPGKNRPGIDRYLLRRVEITQKDGPADIKAKLSGAFDIIHQLLHWRRQRNFARAARNNNK